MGPALAVVAVGIIGASVITLVGLRIRDTHQIKRLRSQIVQLKEGKKLFDQFIKNIHLMKFNDIIQQPQLGWKYNLVVGRGSSGKSTLLNKVFDLNLPVGVTQTTLQISVASILHEKKIKIIDSPGFQDTMNVQTKTLTVALSQSMAKIFICFKGDIRQCTKYIRILKALGKQQNMIFIRTQCDLFQVPNIARSLEQQIQMDKSYLKQIIGSNVHVLSHSSMRNLQYKDNMTIKNMMNE